MVQQSVYANHVDTPKTERSIRRIPFSRANLPAPDLAIAVERNPRRSGLGSLQLIGGVRQHLVRRRLFSPPSQLWNLESKLARFSHRFAVAKRRRRRQARAGRATEAYLTVRALVEMARPLPPRRRHAPRHSQEVVPRDLDPSIGRKGRQGNDHRSAPSLRFRDLSDGPDR